jgi:RNA polymerase sigma-70 factor, ECF subfamily
VSSSWRLTLRPPPEYPPQKALDPGFSSDIESGEALVNVLTMGNSGTVQSRSVNSRMDDGDAALMRRIADKDETALAVVYDRYGRLVYSVALRVLRNTDLAEEVSQDIFYQLWRTAFAFNPSRGSLSGWLLVCTRNRAISRLRGRAFEPAAELREHVGALKVNLEDDLAQAQQISRVRAALEKLQPAQRQALELAYFEGLTHTEIARRTGEPLGTVKTRLRAAVEFLKKALNP